jgi:hypothetical protein
MGWTRSSNSDDARRLYYRDATRRYRARLEYAARWRGFSFDAICAAVGLNPSPQSSLNPARWRACVIFDDLDLRKTIKP